MGTGGEGGTTAARPKMQPKLHLGLPVWLFFSFFRTLIFENTDRQHYCRTHDAATKEADNYVIQRNFQVDLRFHIIPQLALGRDLSYFLLIALSVSLCFNAAF